MNITVIGGSGFIGSSLCEKLQSSGSEFLIIDKKPSYSFNEKVFIADIRFPIQKVLTSDVIVNLAAEHRDDVFPASLYDETNVGGAKNVCKFAEDNKIDKIVFTSSVAVYGFAPLGTNELGTINPFNDYGRTKWEAELIYKAWQAKEPNKRCLVIVRPTVVFGERNRGNVFNLLKQIASGKFIMVGDGFNRKSMAYVENVATFLEYSMAFKPGIHLFNYIDKPDFSMNQLIAHVNKLLGRSSKIRFRLPYIVGICIGKLFDLGAKLTGRKFPISSIRVKKFCANSVYESAISDAGFVPPVKLLDAIARTVSYEFVDKRCDERLFYSE